MPIFNCALISGGQPVSLTAKNFEDAAIRYSIYINVKSIQFHFIKKLEVIVSTQASERLYAVNTKKMTAEWIKGKIMYNYLNPIYITDHLYESS